MVKQAGWAYVPVVALLLSGCMGARVPDGPPPEILPPKPDLAAAPSPEVPVSTFKIPISVDLRPLIEKVKAVVPESLRVPAYAEDFGTGGTGRPDCGVGCGYRVARGPLSLKSEGASLELNGSLGYGFRCRKRIPCVGPHFRASCGWDGESLRTLSLRYAASLEVGKDWSTIVHTRLDSLVAGNPCRVSFLKIDVTPMLLKTAEAAYAKAGPRLDSLVSAHLDLRARASRIWSRLSDPISLTHGAFLDLRPQALSATAPDLDSGRFRISIGLTARPSVRLGGRPAEPASPLPDLSPAEGSDHFRIYLPVLLGYADLNARIKDRFDLDSGGFRFPEKGLLHVVVDSVSVSAFGDRILVWTRFHGAVRGALYMIGLPRFDSVTRILSIDSLAYSLESRSLLLSAANWLKHDDFVDAIQEKLTWELAEPIARMRGEIDRALNREHGALRFQGGLEHLQFADVRSQDDSGDLRVDFFATGKVKIEVVPDPELKPLPGKGKGRLRNEDP